MIILFSSLFLYRIYYYLCCLSCYSPLFLYRIYYYLCCLSCFLLYLSTGSIIISVVYLVFSFIYLQDLILSLLFILFSSLFLYRIYYYLCCLSCILPYFSTGSIIISVVYPVFSFIYLQDLYYLCCLSCFLLYFSTGSIIISVDYPVFFFISLQDLLLSLLFILFSPLFLYRI